VIDHHWSSSPLAVSHLVTVLLDVNSTQDVDDRAESRSYIVADGDTRTALIIDAILENVERDLRILKELNLTLVYALETHVHADHITGASALEERTGTRIVYRGASHGAVTSADRFLADREELRIGKTPVRALATPGHTPGCTSYLVPGGVFTGDG
jgi:glyoxylase-like metal-dependent hydrolase (beta-lactamase superfamily II)